MSKFKIISHKLYGIMRLEEEYNNLCEVMPAFLDLTKQYQFLQCTKDSKELNNLVVLHNKSVDFLISNLNMDNLCNHNGTKVLKLLLEIIPKNKLNAAIESQSGLRKAVRADQLEMVECLLNNFNISVEEAQISYQLALARNVKHVIKLLENKCGGKDKLLSNAIFDPRSFDNIDLYSLSSTAYTKNKNNVNVNKNGMILWLDVSDQSTLKLDKNNNLISWKCKINNNNELVPADFGAGGGKPNIRYTPDWPQQRGMFFNTNQTGIFSTAIAKIRTIASFHSFENSHSGTIERRGGKHNFYIFTSAAHFSFHGDNLRNESQEKWLADWNDGKISKTNENKVSYQAMKKKICNQNWVHKAFKFGTIRLDGISKELAAKDCEIWENQTKIAILSLSENINDKQFERIGRERTYHHFSGTIVELMAFDVELNENDKDKLEKYFIFKYYGPVINIILDATQNNTYLVDYCANYIVACLFGNVILQKFLQ